MRCWQRSVPALLSTGRAGTETTIQMNRAVQAGARAAAEGAALDRAAAAAADALLQAWPDDDQPAWLAHSLRSCTASLREVTGDLLWADGCHPVILRAGESFDRAHLASVSVRYWSDIAEVSARILGEGHPDTMTARERLAAASLAAGQPEEAVSWFECVLTERVRLLGPDHPTAIAARRDVGHALVAAQRPGEGLVVAGDPEHLDRMLVNLLSNAVKYTPRGGTVTLALGRADGSAVLSVADTGLGIPEKDQDLLFARFFRASNAVDSAIPGSGLGLSIVHTIVTNHKGEVSIDSAEGRGTTVTVRIPLLGAAGEDGVSRR